ncbi:DUF3710 domain-containing protein [Arcanobacterium buesumense]|uniref:DUF3710 domain-containing protein n=1 Tax=Arcanobacterium buesumense TaxID=2722751 RepID=A0A6H2EKV6_9ACTO|nr:DUF3710 domain-containing protein [Arcanobacterium buesumense]QJC21693.1 DUF3710 domain-containing protein [Arcanobacterium buesumense]
MAGFFRKKKSESRESQASVKPEHSVQITTGPYDVADHPQQEDLLDAGSLWIPVMPDASIQFSVDHSKQKVYGIVYVIDDAAMQLQVFAAPRSTGIWNDVRRDMITSIAQQGGSSIEVEGTFGTELHAQVPVPDTHQVAPHRFIGIDGPRWLLRITLYGRAGSDNQIADRMLRIARQLVVVRGNTPHPPRELLELHVPQVEKQRGA